MKTKNKAKDRLFQTAGRLFYQHGYRAVGVDTIAAESGIGKMTLYRHFPSKDDLVTAFLRQSDVDFWSYFDQATLGEATARGKLLAFFSALQEYVTSPSCFGCPFLNVASEYPEIDYPGHQVALEHKQSVRARFRQLAEEAGTSQPQAMADALTLLMDGGYLSARMFGSTSENPANQLAEAARRLVDLYC